MTTELAAAHQDKWNEQASKPLENSCFVMGRDDKNVKKRE
jgi:hypothetical protein